MYEMKKTDLQIGTFDDGSRYIFKANDEMTKNHKENNTELYGCYIPENTEWPEKCPVLAFEEYTAHLHPSCESLLQRPRDVKTMKTSEIWYYNKAVGINTLNLFMQNLSIDCRSSQKYTNHSLSTTAITMLARSGFSPKQIMAASGHKSVQGLVIYQRVSDKEKLAMGHSMSNALNAKASKPDVEVKSATPWPCQMYQPIQHLHWI